MFEPQMETESENFTCQDSGLSQVFKLTVAACEKILNIINVVV